MKIVDLSHAIEHGMPSFPGLPVPEVTNIAMIDSDGFREKMLTLTSHTGTHMDAPAHMLNNGKYLDEYEPGHFFGEGAVVSLDDGSHEDTLTRLKQLFSDRPMTKFVLFNTGWDQNWKKDTYFYNSPALSVEIANFLIEYSIFGVGIDSPSVDKLDTSDYEVHQKLFSKDKLIIENMTYLQLLADREFTLSCFPLKIDRADGSPVRAVAILNK